jgi:hypothetical protein
MGIFADSIRLNTQAALLKVNNTVYRIAWELFTSIVRLSPSPNNPGETAKGLLANQWYPSVGSPSGDVGSSTNGSGQDSLNRIDAVCKGVEFLGKNGKLYMTNNLPYAGNAEFIGWPAPQWSGRVKPYRMVFRSLQSVSTLNKLIRI